MLSYITVYNKMSIIFSEMYTLPLQYKIKCILNLFLPDKKKSYSKMCVR